MTRRQPQISDDEAKRLWQRAMELQDEAERSAFPRSLVSQTDDTRLSLEHVAQAAEGVGIHADFVLMALAEAQLPDADEIRRESWRARWLRGAVSEVDAIEVSRLVGGSPASVMAAAKAVAAQPAFNMLLENTVGIAAGPSDCIMVFRLQGGLGHFNSTLNFADVRVLLVTLRPVQEGTHVRIRAPLFRRGVNLSIAGVATTLGGVGGTWSGWTVAALAAGALGVTAGSALLIPAGLGALAGGALGLGGFRSLYGGLVKQGRISITTFLNSIALEVESSADTRLEAASQSVRDRDGGE
ncbi:MAG TPA: hypothetical protein VFZ56_01025 [Gemmatimonadaceae bacterium]